MTVVVDASAVVQALAPDESGALGEQVLVRVQLAGAIAPQAFADEIAQVAVRGVRTGRWSERTARLLVDRVAALDIELADRVAPSSAQLETALETGLTGSDASYVQLALATGLPLATADARMRAAAERAGVACL